MSLSLTFVRFEGKPFPAQKSTSASGATKNISIEMTYLRKKNEEKGRQVPLHDFRSR